MRPLIDWLTPPSVAEQVFGRTADSRALVPVAVDPPPDPVDAPAGSDTTSDITSATSAAAIANAPPIRAALMFMGSARSGSWHRR